MHRKLYGIKIQFVRQKNTLNGQKIIFIYGNDESRSRWFDPKDIINTSEMIVNRDQIPISATMVREMMVLDKRKEWMQMVNPKLHKMYNELRDELISVPFYNNYKNNI